MILKSEVLREQIDFLDSYPWREGHVPPVVDGVLVLLGTLLDKEEGYR